MQQVGGSLGIAFLSTMFADAVGAFAPAAGTPAGLAAAEAAVHGYTVAFWWAAGALAVGAVVTALLSRPRAARAEEQVAAGVVPEGLG